MWLFVMPVSLKKIFMTVAECLPNNNMSTLRTENKPGNLSHLCNDLITYIGVVIPTPHLQGYSTRPTPHACTG